MSSRIGNHVDFPNYEVDELVGIARVMARDLEYDVDDASCDMFKKYITRRMELPFFSNARTVRNAIDLARMRMSVRIYNEKTSPGSDGMVTEGELMTLTGPDFPSVAELESQGDSAIVA